MFHANGKKCKALHVPRKKTCISVTDCPCVKAKNLARMVLLAIVANQLLQQDLNLLLNSQPCSTTLFHAGAHPLSLMCHVCLSRCTLIPLHLSSSHRKRKNSLRLPLRPFLHDPQRRSDAALRNTTGVPGTSSTAEDMSTTAMAMRACGACESRRFSGGGAQRMRKRCVKVSGIDGRVHVGVLCGGPSPERGISLNSARSALDHLQDDLVVVHPYYVDVGLDAYRISQAQMYCNTPSDFDFKLQDSGQRFQNLQEFAQHLQEEMDVVLPALHGVWGEDGGVQKLLEDAGVPFIGTGAAEAEAAFDKVRSSTTMRELGYPVLESTGCSGPGADLELELRQWMASRNLCQETAKLVVKPARAGSSVGVSVLNGAKEAAHACKALEEQGIGKEALVEVYARGGIEFTAIVLEGPQGPVALLPTEVELVDAVAEDSANLEEDMIFNYRRKYLPSDQVRYHTPPRVPKDVVQAIRRGAVSLFRDMKLKDIARIDGWVLSTAFEHITAPDASRQYLVCPGGLVTFTDINIMSGMEQTSFLFQQAAEVGFSHAAVLREVLFHSCSKSGVPLHKQLIKSTEGERKPARQKVFVIFGGNTSERQVSLMSGTNIWLKLRSFKDLHVTPFLLASVECADSTPVHEYPIYELPYANVLRHTVEEVIESCKHSLLQDKNPHLQVLRELVVEDCRSVGLAEAGRLWEPFQNPLPPKRMIMSEFAHMAKSEGAVVFNAIHGGAGENGILQRLFEEEGVLFTGSGSSASELCMDKAMTGDCIQSLAQEGIYSAKKRTVSLTDLPAGINESAPWTFQRLASELNSSELCVKPGSDGCSTGVARLVCAEDLVKYVCALRQGLAQIPPNTFQSSHGIIEMPLPPPSALLFEPFISSRRIVVCQQENGGGEKLQCVGDSEWVEITVGIIGVKGKMHALNPSITVAESAVLSLEEKFQGGTGINLTPPPPIVALPAAVAQAKLRIEKVADLLGINGFARIDAFMHVRTGELIIIEANTVPGMTPSTVLFHQALEETPPMFPKDFFRSVVNYALEEKA